MNLLTHPAITPVLFTLSAVIFVWLFKFPIANAMAPRERDWSAMFLENVVILAILYFVSFFCQHRLDLARDPWSEFAAEHFSVWASFSVALAYGICTWRRLTISRQQRQESKWAVIAMPLNSQGDTGHKIIRFPQPFKKAS